MQDAHLTLPGGPRLRLRRAPGARRPVLLVHGLASNALLWEGVGRRLAEAGHEVVAVNQRGHGGTEETDDGYDTATAASDLAALIRELDWTGERAPVVAGQSWGGNVVLTLAAEHGGTAGVAMIDGGWIYLRESFPTFERCWDTLAPPTFDHLTAADFEAFSAQWHADWPEETRRSSAGSFRTMPDGTVRPWLSREHHRSILHSLWAGDPRPLYPKVDVPASLLAAVPAVPPSSAVTEAAERMRDAQVHWYVGAHHDLHAQHPERCADDLLALIARADGKE